MSRVSKSISVTVGEDTVSFRLQGSRHVRTAQILGREVDDERMDRIWLDRVALNLDEFDRLEDGWRATGAVSTVLIRAVPAASGVRTH